MGEAARRMAVYGDGTALSSSRQPRQEEVALLSPGDARDIRAGKVLLLPDRQRVAESAEQLIRANEWLARKYQEQFEMNTRTRMRADSAIARNRDLESEIASLRDLQGQELGNAIFDSYARTWEELASRVTELEERLVLHEPLPAAHYG